MKRYILFLLLYVSGFAQFNPMQFYEFGKNPVIPANLYTGNLLYLDSALTDSYPRTGSTWYDLSSSPANGTLTNGVTFLSQNRGVMSFDGANDYVDIGNISKLNFERTNSFSVSLWVYFNTVSSGVALIGKILNPSSSPSSGWLVGTVSTNQFNFLLRNTANTNEVQVRTAVGTLSANTWYNLVVTYSGNSLASGVKIYLNGSQTSGDVVTTNSLTASITSSASLAIGSRPATSSLYFNGKLPVVNVYNYVLTSTEVLDDFNNIKSRFGY